jgi:hypothetical protein
MNRREGSKKPAGIYLLLVWMVLNVALLLLMIPGDSQDPNNYVELILWIPSIAGLWLMKKWGAALTIATLCITLSTIMGIIMYYPSLETYALVNTIGIVYLFRRVFSGKFN